MSEVRVWCGRDRSILGLILLVGLVHGLLYVFFIPPWQHPDEPNHFEHAWLITRGIAQPTDHDRDEAMNRQVAESMIAHGFYDGVGYQPDLKTPGQAVWIGGYPQLDEPPVYYWIVSFPMRLAPAGSVTLQLYLARVGSLVLFLVSLAAAWGICRELTSQGSRLRWMVPISMALLPGYVDLMTAVNNDVGAVAIFSLFFWSAIRLVQRGLSLPDLLWALIATNLGLWTKRTAFFAVPLFGVALILAIFRQRWRWVAWTILGGGAVMASLAIFTWGDATLWYRQSLQDNPTRSPMADAPLGKHVFRLEMEADQPLSQLVQILPISTGESLRGKTVTLGAWVWADRPLAGLAPVLYIQVGEKAYTQEIAITTRPEFYAFTTSLEKDPRRSWVALRPATNPDAEHTTVFFDGVVLAEGSYDQGEVPVFSDPDGREGMWGGKPFVNLLRQASAEGAWPYIRPWADQWGSRLFPDYGQDRLSLALYSLLDLPASGWYYQLTIRNLLHTFWGRFGWGHVPLLGSKPYRILAALTMLGLVGAGLALASRWRQVKWRQVAFLGLVLVGIWGITLIRGSNYIFLRAGFLSSARYAFPAIIPTMLFLNRGWKLWMEAVESGLKFPGWAANLGFIIFFLGLDIFSWMSIHRFYQA